MWAVAVATLPTSAQEVDSRTDAPVHVGPFYITPVLELSHLGVDTNVFNTSGRQQSDFTFTAGPKVDIVVPLRRFLFTAETVTDFVYYQQFENQRGINFDMTLRGEVQLPKLSFFVEDSFLDTRQRPNFEIDVRARRQENELRSGISLDVFRKLELEFAASQSVREYAGDDAVGSRLAIGLNRDAVAVSGSLRYAATPVTTVVFTGEMREERYTFAPARDNDSWSLVPGVEFNPRALISGSAEVGYRQLHGLDELLPDFQGPVAAVDLSYKLLGSTTIQFSANRDVEFSFYVDEPYYVEAGFGIAVRHQLTPPFGVSIGTQRFNLTYRKFESGVSSGAESGRVDTIRAHSVALHFRLTQATEIGFDIARRNRRSSVGQTRDYDGLMAGMTMSYAF